MSATKLLLPDIKNIDLLLLTIIEYCLYIFIFLLFAGKLGAIKTIAYNLSILLGITLLFRKRSFGFSLKNPIFIFIAFYLISAIVSSFAANNVLKSLLTVKGYHLKIFVLYVLFVFTFLRSNSINRCILICALSAILYLFLGYFNIFRDLYSSGVINYIPMRYYSTILVTLAPFIMAEYMMAINLWRLTWLFFLVCSLFLILIIGVRGSWLATLGELSIWSFFLGVRSLSKKIFIAALILVLSIFILFIIFFPHQASFYKEHTLNTIQLEYRLKAWRLYTNLAMKKFILGHGLDESQMEDEYVSLYNKYYGHDPMREAGEATTPHNQFLKVFYQQGIIGLISFIGLLFTTIFMLFKQIKRLKPPLYFMAIAVLSAIIGEYFIHLLLEDRSIIPLGVLLGLAGTLVEKQGIKRA